MKALFKLSERPYCTLLFALALAACDDDDATQATPHGGEPLAVETGDVPVAEPPAAIMPPKADVTQADAGAAEPPPWEGPFFVVTRSSTGVYQEPTVRRELKLGYLQEGAQIGVHAEPLKKA